MLGRQIRLDKSEVFQVNEDRDKASGLEGHTVLSSHFDIQADITESTLNKE